MECKKGFEMVQGIECIEGEWIYQTPICTAKDCGDIPQGFLSSGNASDTTFPNIAKYTCDEGHEYFSGKTELSCLASGQWETDVLACQPKDCGLPPPGISSTVTVNGGTTFPNTASYNCDDGHYIDGGKIEISCLASGKWETDVLVCEAKDCGAVPPGNFSTGTAASGTTYPNKADYTCNEGHEEASGDFSIKCLASGQWDVANILVCQAKDCGAVPPGNFSTGTAASGTTYPNKAEYTCNEGHEEASGDISIKCLASGQWDVANILVCQAKDCGDLPPGTLSTGKGNGRSTFPNTANYTCDEGHERVSGKTEISCLASGQWETGVLVCKAKDCGPHPQGILSMVTDLEVGTTYPNIASYTCKEGHERASGQTSIRCLESGQWESDVLVCEPKDCGDLPQGTFSSGIANGGSTFSYTATYTCYEGHPPLSGKAEISCLASGLWETDILRCHTKDCGAVPPGNFSTGTAASGTTYPNKADYTCNEGHEEASGDISIKCLASGQWDVANILVCQAKDCGAVPPGNFSTGTAASGTTYPNKAEYTCNEGHEEASGDISIKCLASGQWDVANILVCQAKDCGAVPPGNFSTGTAASGTTYPNKADYTCNEGHEEASGDISIKCLASGQWDVANILVCQAKDCGDLPPGTLSTGKGNGRSTFPNTANYTCDEGHERVSGKTEISCLASGQWETGVLVCKAKDCGPHPQECKYYIINDAYLAFDDDLYMDEDGSTQAQCDKDCQEDAKCTVGVLEEDVCYLFRKPVIFYSYDLDFNQCIATCIQMDECLLLDHLASDICYIYNDTPKNDQSGLEIIDESNGDKIVEKIC
ncbi:hypothetical protein LOTGIDRAFT_162881 [Lottia gigantea]|uniref:Sushi domain-containing protein n=1 Tax=Lottia gigantea TaxID=225164 RepID=V4AFQ9_LOTGI|nr:hypothetical protein LOTGIDRAFT_162881 [Lottia gigantea]ESO92226.1 hypothetical protein LOTGIDRAFT_162881 [Lottia gigantea]